MNKDVFENLRNFLPSDLISEMNTEQKEIKTLTYAPEEDFRDENGDEEIDDLAYHSINKSKTESTQANNPRTKNRLYSDTSIQMKNQNRIINHTQNKLSMCNSYYPFTNYQLCQCDNQAKMACNYPDYKNEYLLHQPLNSNMNQYKYSLDIFNDYQLRDYRFSFSNNEYNCNNQSNLPNFNINQYTKYQKNTIKTSSWSRKKTSCDSLSSNSKLIFHKQSKVEFNVEQFEIDEFTNYIKGIRDNLVEVCSSPKGSKDLMKMLKKNPNECCTILINEWNTSITKLMQDSNGNYFCQDFLNILTQDQIHLILSYIKPDFVSIAKNYSGTHVLQVLVSLSQTIELQSTLIKLIQNAEIEMCIDINATHVLQKIIETIHEDHRYSLNNKIIQNFMFLSLNSNGVCILKMFITKTWNLQYKQIILQIITFNCLEIAQNAYGNYIIQFLIEKWGVNYTIIIVKILISHISILSTQKYASNVAEKVIQLLGEHVDLKEMVYYELFRTNSFLGVLKNIYGKYVLLKTIKTMNKDSRESLRTFLEKNYWNKEKMNKKVKHLIEQCKL